MADLINYSQEQLDIINSRGTDILASASAGSGKTTVMLERARSLIVDEHVPIRRLLMLSFNKAIAAEMKAKLIDKLENECILRPDLIKQIDDAATSQITTIDGFCNSLVSEHFERLGIDGSYEIVEGATAKTLLNNAIANVMRQLKQSEDPNIYDIIGKFGNKMLTESISAIYQYSCVMPDREAWLSSAASGLENKLFDIITAKYIKLLHIEHSPELNKAIELRGKHGTENDAYYAIVIDILQQIIQCTTYDELYNVKRINAGAFNGLRIKNKSHDEDKYWLNLCKTSIKSIFAKLQYDYTTAKAIYAQSSQDSATLAEYTLMVMVEYNRIKQEQGVLEFADINFYAAKLLRDDKFASEIAGKYDYLFVDEYQDTNYIGEYIISRLSRNNLCMVGDAKQSIYRFRLAEPQIMVDKAARMSAADAANKGKDNYKPTCINLNDNYRSDRGILDFANAVFGEIMTADYGGVDYRNTAAFNARSEYQRTNDLPIASATWIYKEPKANVKTDSIKVGDNVETEQKSVLNELNGVYNPYEDISNAQSEESFGTAEGNHIANIIEKLLKSQIWDAKRQCSAAVKPSDICILSRNRMSKGDVVDTIIKTIKQRGISVADQSMGRAENLPEIQDIIQMLKVIDNDSDEIALASVLRGPWCLMTSAELYELRRANMSVSFAACVSSAMESNAKVNKLYAVVRELRHRLAYSNVYDTVCSLTYEFGYIQRLMQSAQSLQCVEDYISSLTSCRLSLSEYLTSSTLVGSNAKMSFASDYAVQMATIHASKGLEFPIVILINAADTRRQHSAAIALHKDYGVCVHRYDESNMRKNNNYVLSAMRAMEWQEELNEEMRLLYVALTRAKNHLFITGSLKTKDISADCYTPPYNVSSYKDWISNAVYSGRLNKRFVKVISDAEIDAPDVISQANAVDYSAASDEIAQRIAYQYPHSDAAALRLKHTVTELIEYERYEDTPIFEGFYDEDANINRALRGTNYHVILENLDYYATTDKQVRTELDRMVAEGLIDQEQLQNIKISELTAITNSDIIDLARRSDRIMKEKKFMLKLKADEIYNNGCLDDILIQGAIDLIIVGEQLTIVDFKKSSKSPQELAKTYAVQLNLYALAAQQALGRKVDRKVIFDISRGIAIDIK